MIPLAVVPRDYAERLVDQLDSAMQIIAALVLTDDEVIAAKGGPEAEGADRLRGWAKSMREELLDPESEYGRALLVKCLTAQGFHTNTNRGYCTGPLKERVPGAFRMAEATQALVAVTTAYAAGEGERLPRNPDKAIAAMAPRVLAAFPPSVYGEALASHNKVAVDWLFKGGNPGVMQTLQAGMKRMVLDSRRAKEQERGNEE